MYYPIILALLKIVYRYLICIYIKRVYTFKIKVNYIGEFNMVTILYLNEYDIDSVY